MMIQILKNKKLRSDLMREGVRKLKGRIKSLLRIKS
jgi:hypothetical protein